MKRSDVLREIVEARRANYLISGCHLLVWVIGYLIYAIVVWLFEGHWPKSLWVVFWIFVGFLVLELLESHLQTVLSAVLEAKSHLSNISEKVEKIEIRLNRLEKSLSNLDDRVPGQKSLLDEY